MPRRTHVNEPLKWLTAHHHDLAPLTGQDLCALQAIACCWELYALGDDDGHRAALAAVGHLLRGMQRKNWHLAKSLIPWAMDWSDEDRVWKLLVDRDPGIVASYFGGAS